MGHGIEDGREERRGGDQYAAVCVLVKMGWRLCMGCLGWSVGNGDGIGEGDGGDGEVDGDGDEGDGDGAKEGEAELVSHRTTPTSSPPHTSHHCTVLPRSLLPPVPSVKISYPSIHRSSTRKETVWQHQRRIEDVKRGLR